MNWDAIGAIGEILGAIGVIVTLAYLAIQIRHNTKVARAATRQAISDSTVGIVSDLTSSDSMADIMVRAFEGESLTKAESFRLHARCYRDMKHFENMYHQLNSGLLPNDELSSFRENLKVILVAAPYVEYWKLESSLFSPQFQTEVSILLKQIAVQPAHESIVSRLQAIE
ncbi:MAG: hypothetical protein GKR91_11260 [Pseudomonadales bacterium]|nr:hypothetical protein [Pseudomonadales bacterium]